MDKALFKKTGSEDENENLQTQYVTGHLRWTDPVLPDIGAKGLEINPDTDKLLDAGLQALERDSKHLLSELKQGAVLEIGSFKSRITVSQLCQ